MNTRILFLFLIILLFSCHKRAENPAQPDSKAEMRKWKEQLLLNGEIGTPCDANNQEKWAINNPEVFYGLPDSIRCNVFDVNDDSINDLLLYFPAGDCCSCTIGINEGSDFVKLIYSHGSDFIENDNLQGKIETKIKSEFYIQTNTEAGKAIFSITGFNKKITGTYQLWTLEDPDCCAGTKGTFTYDPFTLTIELNQEER